MNKHNWKSKKITIDPMNEHGNYEETVEYSVDSDIDRLFCSTIQYKKGKYVETCTHNEFDDLEECIEFCESKARVKITEEIEKFNETLKLLGF